MNTSLFFSILVPIFLFSINFKAQIPHIQKIAASKEIDTLQSNGLGLLIAGKKMLSRYSLEDSIQKVIRMSKRPGAGTQWLLNGEEIHQTAIQSLRTEFITSLEVDKYLSEAQIEEYRGIIRVTYKEAYQARFKTLKQIAEKYKLNDSENLLLFLIDGIPVMEKYDVYQIDEKFILKIEIYEKPTFGEGKACIFANLISRTKSNVEAANTIYIRGI